MPRPLSQPPLIWLLLTAQILSPLPSYIGVSKSMALGTTIAAASIVFIRWAYGAVWGGLPLHRTLDFAMRPALLVLLLCALILAHIIVASEIQPVDLTRCTASLVALMFLLLGGMTLGMDLANQPDSNVDSAVRISLWVFLALIVLKLAGIEPRSYAFEKPMFPYVETSHFALAFGPILMYRCVRAGRARALWWLIAGFGLALALQSMALLLCCFLIAAACRRMLLISIVGVVVMVGGLPLELAYFTSRADFSDTTTNVSSLVYIQGWQQVQECLRWTSGWGVGFQQMGFREPEVGAAQMIHLLVSGEDLNTTDGGFVFAKLASEFGIVGILLGMFYILTAARCLTALRRRASSAAATLAQCVVVAYAVDMFARGPGYFVESTLLFVAALAALLTIRKPLALRPTISNLVPDRLSASL
jgi:hypothetical protein